MDHPLSRLAILIFLHTFSGALLILMLVLICQEADEFKFTTNIIRWRHKRGNLGRPELGDDGRALRESNTRLVRWSDGSTQLLVGDEAFDVGEHSIDRCDLRLRYLSSVCVFVCVCVFCCCAC